MTITTKRHCPKGGKCEDDGEGCCVKCGDDSQPKCEQCGDSGMFETADVENGPSPKDIHFCDCRAGLEALRLERMHGDRDFLSWQRKSFNDEAHCTVVEQINVERDEYGYGGGAMPHSPPGWYFTLEAYVEASGESLHCEVQGPFPSSLMALLFAYEIIVRCTREAEEEQRAEMLAEAAAS